MANPYSSDPLKKDFASGDTDYITNLNSNFTTIENVGTTQDVRIEGLEQANVGGDADAFQNIPNLLHNGSFIMSLCGPENEDDSYVADIPDNDGTRELVRWADGWWLQCDEAVGDVVVESVDTMISGMSGLRRALRLKAGGSGVNTGKIYQRVDLWVDLRELKSKSVRFSVAYTAIGDDEFSITVDDGVETSTEDSTPAGSGQVSVTHTVDANATKLTVYITFTLEAVANNLEISYAHLRLGNRTVNIVGYIPPPDIVAETIRSQMVTRDLVYDDVVFASSFEDANVEEAHVTESFEVPFIASGDYIRYDSYLEGFSPSDDRDLNDLSWASDPSFPDLTLVNKKRWGVNCESAPGAPADKDCYNGVTWYMKRDITTAGGDSDISPATGFAVYFFIIMLRLIPLP